MTKTEIGNKALQRIGMSQFMANIDVDNSPQASALRLAFDSERDLVLRAYPWPFATAYATLALVAGTTDTPANRDWTFAYRLPADCLKARRIVTERGRREARPREFKIGRDGQGKLVYTDEELAQLEYTVAITNPAEFDPMCASALAWRLAMAVAPAFSRIKGMIDTAVQMYQIEINQAEAAASNEGQERPPDDAEWVRDR